MKDRKKIASYFHTMQGKLFLYMLIVSLSIVTMTAAALLFHSLIARSEKPENITFLVCQGNAESLDENNCYFSGTDADRPALTGRFSRENAENGLFRYSNETATFIGFKRSLRHPLTGETMQLYGLIPEQEFRAGRIRDLLWNIFLVLFLFGISVFLCFFMSKRFAKPLLRCISDYQAGQKSDSPIQEIDDLFSFLEQKDLAHSRELSRLAFDRKNEIDPYQYQLFLTGFESLTPTEREIFDLYVDGKDTKEITRIKGIRESTLRYHNRNIYSKLGIRSLKQMLRYAAVMKEEDK